MNLPEFALSKKLQFFKVFDLGRVKQFLSVHNSRCDGLAGWRAGMIKFQQIVRRIRRCNFIHRTGILNNFVAFRCKCFLLGRRTGRSYACQSSLCFIYQNAIRIIKTLIFFLKKFRDWKFYGVLLLAFGVRIFLLGLFMRTIGFTAHQWRLYAFC